ATQTQPGTSGDVPSFSPNALPASGDVGGAGWRRNAFRIIILATDRCPVAAFPAGSPIPATITNNAGRSEPVTAVACSTPTAVANRFGYVSDSPTVEGNTIVDADGNRTAVVPRGAATVQGTIDALNARGIRVIGMGPNVTPTSSTVPSFAPRVWLSALARL